MAAVAAVTEEEVDQENLCDSLVEIRARLRPQSALRAAIQ